MFQSTFMAQKKIKDYLESQKSSGKKKKKKLCHTNSLETQNSIQISLHPLAPGHIFSLVSFLAPLKL